MGKAEDKLRGLKKKTTKILHDILA